jgi:hypothetical protein
LQAAQSFAIPKGTITGGSKKKEKIDDIRIVIEDVLAEPIKLRASEKSLTVSKLEAMLQVQRVNALKGDPKAVKTLFKLAQKTGMFSQAQLKGFMVIGDAGNPEEQMLLKAFHAAQQLDSPNETTKLIQKPRDRG